SSSMRFSNAPRISPSASRISAGGVPGGVSSGTLSEVDGITLGGARWGVCGSGTGPYAGWYAAAYARKGDLGDGITGLAADGTEGVMGEAAEGASGTPRVGAPAAESWDGRPESGSAAAGFALPAADCPAVGTSSGSAARISTPPSTRRLETIKASGPKLRRT